MQRLSKFSLILFLLVVNSSLFATNGYRNGFIPNQGQWSSQVEYRMSIPSGAVFLEKDAITYALFNGKQVAEIHGKAHDHQHIEAHQPALIDHHALRMHFLGNRMVEPRSILPGATKFNYYKGKDRRNWAGGLLAYQEVFYDGFYPQTDLRVYTNDQGMKYDFIVHPGGNPSDILFEYQGADKVKLQKGNITIKTSLGEIVEMAPIAWQIIDGVKVPVQCSFQLINGVVSFETSSYNANHDLIIDPQVIFATYSGSTDDNWGFTATYDNAGNGYSGGIAFGANFPTTLGAYQVPFGGGQIDIGILKYTPDGTNALYITYLGGSDMELPHSMIVNEYDELLIYGTTGSDDFPVTNGAYSTNFQGGPPTSFENGFISINNGVDLFIVRLSTDGSTLLASTFVGGTGNDGLNSAPELVPNYADEIRGSLWVDSDNNVYVGTSTESTDFPVSSNAIQPVFGGGTQDGVILKLDGNLSTLQWATYLGGQQNDGIFYLTVDRDENVVVTGGTVSQNFPVTANAFQGSSLGDIDGFVSKIDSSGSTLIASTYISSSVYDQSYIVGTDNTNHVYIFGQTASSGNEFILDSPVAVPGGNQFLTKLSPDLSSRVWSTTFGNASGQPDIAPTALLVDVCDKIYVTGWGGAINSFGTTTNGLTTTPDAFQSTTDGNDFYLYVIDNQAQNLEYASFLGGNGSLDHVDGGTSRFDRKGVIYQSICAGCGGLSDLPVTPNAFSPTNNSSNCNNALVKFDFESPITVSAFVNANDPVGCAPYTVNFENTSVNADQFSWRLENVEIGTSQNLSYTFTSSGVYEVILIASSSQTCNESDTVSITITVLESIQGNLPDITGCIGQEVILGPDGFTDPYYSFQWTPAFGLSDDGVKKPTLVVDTTTSFTLIVSIGSCADTLIQVVNAEGGSVTDLPPVSACVFDTVQIGLSGPIQGAVSYQWFPSNNLSSPTIYNPEYTVDDDASLSLAVTSAEGCVDTFNLQIDSRTDSIDAGPDVNACSDEPAQIGLPDLQNNYTYQWSPSTGLSAANEATPIAIVNQTTQYSLLKIPKPGVAGCPGTDQVTINIVAKPTALFGVNTSGDCTGVSVQVSDSSSNYLELDWFVNNGITIEGVNPTFNFPYSDTLKITLIARNGECRDTISYSEYIKGLKDFYKENTVNAFSPNGDGINDCFSPALQLENNAVNTKFLPCSDVIIYDRWGIKVFDSSTEGDNSCWDGKNQAGEEMPEAVYFYVYIYEAEQKEGFVHLKREK
jgi:gliding motility-associated-like protein